MTEEENKTIYFLHAEFAGEGSAQFTVSSNVSALQILGLASFLELMAKSKIMEEQHKAEETARQSGIAIPQGQILKPN